MAERRMFSRRVVNSARFLRMPPICQALYYHLGMNADDDGIVEAYSILKAIDATEEDLGQLAERGFVQILNDDLVTFIIDWTENNKIRPDRKQDSIYKDLLLEAKPDAEIIERRQRSDTKKPAPSAPEDVQTRSADSQCADNGRSMDGPRTADGPHRLGKDRLGKDSINNNTVTDGDRESVTKRQIDAEFEKIWQKYPKKRGKTDALKAYTRARKAGTTAEQVGKGLDAFLQTIQGTDDRFIPYGSTWFHQKRWEDDYTPAQAAPIQAMIRHEDWDYDKLMEASIRNALNIAN